MANTTTIANTTPDTTRLDQIASHNWTATGLAFITTIGFFALIGVLLLVSWAGGGSPAPVTGATTAAGAALTQGPFHDLLNTVIGIVGTGWATIVGYYFGSSTGSKQKTETLSEVALRSPGSERARSNELHGQPSHLARP
jgi:membrane protein DedA with SNARE-associated domain